VKTLSLLLLIVCASLTSAQTVPSSCDAPDSVKNLYRTDAALAVLYINHPFYHYHDDSTVADLRDSVIVYPYRTDTIVRPMLAVWNALPLFPRDSVRRVENIHQHWRNFVRKITLEIDTGSTWGNNLYKGKIPTGNAVVDSLFSVYQLFVDTSWDYRDDLLIVDIASKMTINGPMLTTIFTKIPDVHRAYQFVYGDGDYITCSFAHDTASLLYSDGWGDCPSGCTERRFWKFTVFPDCSVRFDGSYGDPFSSWSVYEPVQKTLSLYPNPVTDKLIIEADERGTVVISDVSGNSIRTASIIEGKNELIVRELPSGMYFVTICDRNGNLTTGRFIKM
jgi:hypothetical protein